MPPIRPTIPTRLPHLEIMTTDDGSRTLCDRQLNETYHSGCGALLECLHVYLRNSGIEAKLIQRQSVRVLELGFGTGMGWLLTAVAAQALGSPLEYVSLEKHLLPVDILQQLDSATAIDEAVSRQTLPQHYSAAQALQAQLLRGLAQAADDDSGLFRFTPTNTLWLIRGDARESLQPELGRFDAIYFDAFSPATNPELWQETMFTKLSGLIKSDGLLVSYCVSGAVRRALSEAGFKVTRMPGPPGGKREVLVAGV